MPLSPPSGPGRPADSARAGSRSGLPSLLGVAGSLGIVLGLFLLVAWLFRRAAPGQSSLLPGEVLELLGRCPLAPRLQLHLLRLGSKLVLISVSGERVQALGEVSDPAEVTRLAGLCRQTLSQRSTAAFGQVLKQLSKARQEEGPDA